MADPVIFRGGPHDGVEYQPHTYRREIVIPGSGHGLDIRYVDTGERDEGRHVYAYEEPF